MFFFNLVMQPMWLASQNIFHLNNNTFVEDYLK
jgi:hypothetical protein